ncbi:MAG: GAF domain-containing protein [Acidimicrobiia bacterium]|nr:GAF domain-containing protein [Acidimicrobiia bacterium]
MEDGALSLSDLDACFEGAVPAVIATASADGSPNVTYLSRVRRVDDTHLALSNQFFSKTSRNLAENPRASVLLIDPTTYDQFRVTLAYTRDERRGPVFEQLRGDVDAVAAISGMQDVFRLRAADVYRVVGIEKVLAAVHLEGADAAPAGGPEPDAVATAQLAELGVRLGRCSDLDTLVGTTVDGLADLLRYDHALLLLLDEQGRRLYTIASHGYETEGVGSEVAVGEGIIGMAAARCAPVRLGSLGQMGKYSRTVRRSFERTGGIGPDREIPLPGLPDADSRVAVPMLVGGRLVGVLVVESRQAVAFTEADEAVLTVVASLVGNAIEAERAREHTTDATVPGHDASHAPARASAAKVHVRFFPVDGSTFVDGDYLIKGVAGRILWSLLGEHEREGRVHFTNREVRLDPTLEMPELRDNFESRLILLKRRLEERVAPIRIEKTGRGRFRLVVETPLRLEAVGGG